MLHSTYNCAVVGLKLFFLGGQVNQADSHQKTPLYVATYHGRTDIVSLLLEANANVNTADKNGKTPLYAAVLHGHLNLAAKLLSHGASVSIRSFPGYSLRASSTFIFYFVF